MLGDCLFSDYRICLKMGTFLSLHPVDSFAVCAHLKVSASTCKYIASWEGRHTRFLGFIDINSSCVPGYFKFTSGYSYPLILCSNSWRWGGVGVGGDKKKGSLCPATDIPGKYRRNADHSLIHGSLYLLFSRGLSIINLVEIILVWGFDYPEWGLSYLCQ